MSKRHTLSISFVLLVSLVFGASQDAWAKKLQVVASVPDLAALAQAVGGPRVVVKSLALATQDPHFVDARPHLMLTLNRADLLLVIGLDLEVGWLPNLLTGARNARIRAGAPGYLDCSTLVNLQQVPKVRVDRSQGDIHPGGNPHFLTDPDNALRVARGIAARLRAVDPAGAAFYGQRLQKFVSQLEAAKRRWKAKLAPYARTKVVGFHDAWSYFSSAFGLEMVAYLEPKPGIPPNAAHLLRVIRLMRREKVALVLQQLYYPDRSSRLVASKAGATLLRVAGGTAVERGETYLRRMERLVERVVAALARRRRG